MRVGIRSPDAADMPRSAIRASLVERSCAAHKLPYCWSVQCAAVEHWRSSRIISGISCGVAIRTVTVALMSKLSIPKGRLAGSWFAKELRMGAANVVCFQLVGRNGLARFELSPTDGCNFSDAGTP